MDVVVVNGSPRKKWNTATMLQHFMEGAEAAGARCRLVHLYDYTFKGCISCFECKKIGGKSYGRCAVKDELKPLLDTIRECDVLALGSPIYFGSETGEMRSLVERLLFPYLTYTPERETLYPKKIRTALLYTMNVTEEQMPQFGYTPMFERNKATMSWLFGHCEMLLCTDTYQFSDYSKYKSTMFDVAAKAKRRDEVFPQECAKARELGSRLVQEQREGQGA